MASTEAEGASTTPTICTIATNSKPAAEDHGTRRRRKQKRGTSGKEKCDVDEKARITRRVKNLVKRMRLEQNLIDAYSSEGWKGHNREKIRPEVELRRAQGQIVRCQVAIRDLIRDLEDLGREGSLEKSAFDEEGRIFHEEIFCAKCKSQEAAVDNDIILCDGACDRGFHQRCLEPPLATSDIPPGDEGWLCPVCDYKADCLDHINGLLGTDYHVDDRWDKIFPAAAGGDGATTVSEDWPSDDSEDDEYDPSEKQKPTYDYGESAGLRISSSANSGSEPEASSTSDSDEGESSSDVSGDRKLRGGVVQTRVSEGENRGSEVHCLVGEVPALGKRRRKPVDYKTLQAQIFGRDGEGDLGSSDDEEWGPKSRGRRKPAGGAAGQESNGLAPLGQGCPRPNSQYSVDGNESNHTKPVNAQQKERRARRRLPVVATDLLRREFQAGNHFPSRAFKESLTHKLGMSYKQVCSWFKHARHVAKAPTGPGTSRWAAPQLHSGDSRERGAVAEEIEITNGVLVEKVDEVQQKLRHLKQTLEAMVARPCSGTDPPGQGVSLTSDRSHCRGKQIKYVPVALVVEKKLEKASANM